MRCEIEDSVEDVGDGRWCWRWCWGMGDGRCGRWEMVREGGKKGGKRKRGEGGGRGKGGK